MRLVLAALASIVGLILILPVVLLSIPLIAVYNLTAALARFIEARCVPWKDLISFDPVIGWKPKANLDVKYLAADGQICHVKTDACGWVGTRAVSNADIVIFGDSFAFGYGVNFEQTFFEKLSHPRIKGIGAPGYNMVQELLLMRELAPQLREKLVIWFICLDNDLYDNLNPNKPNFYKTPFVASVNGNGDWRVVTEHVAPTRNGYAPQQSPYYPMLAKFCTEGFVSDRAFSASGYLIREARDVCRAAGAELVVMTIPNRHQLTDDGVAFLSSYLPGSNAVDPDYPDKRIAKNCEELGVRFIAAKQHLGTEHYKRRDPHWNESGHQRVADLLAQVYRDYLSRKDDSIETSLWRRLREAGH
jgi:hypothetical protein